MKTFSTADDVTLNNTWKIVALLVVIAGVFISAFKIFTPYSYWFDELYSVNASALAWTDLHQLLLADVHPPLYQVILKIWMSTFGGTEPTTRILSWLFATASLVVALRFASKTGGVFLYCVAVCFSANMLFTFYANETRAYAMALFLSTLLLTLFPFAKNHQTHSSFFIVALLLSLTHYFGLILAGVMLAAVFIQNLKNAATLLKATITGLACLIWPLYHIFNGSITSYTSGNFWINIESPLQSINVASYILVAGSGRIGAVIFLFSLVIGCVICYLQRDAVKRFNEVANIGFLCAAMVLFIVCLIAAVDSYTPISTSRNYIVIVPLSIFALAATVHILAASGPILKKTLLVLVTVYSCLALVVSYKQLVSKSQIRQDWKNAISAAAKDSSAHKLYYYAPDRLVDHYFKENNIPVDDLTKYVPNETMLTPRSIVAYGYLSEERYLEFERSMLSLNARHLFPIENYRAVGHAGVFVID